MNITVNVFEIGNDTIEEMKSMSSDQSNENLESMAKVINGLKSSVEKYHKYSTIGFWGKLFTSDLEIKANITIAMINFESNLEKGSVFLNRLKTQYEQFDNLYHRLEQINQKFSDDIEKIDSIINEMEAGSVDQQRLMRKKNDLISAQVLAHHTAQQHALSKNNVSILIDKFMSIENILKPIITQNIKLSNSDIFKLTNL